MNIREYSTIFYPINSREIKIKRTENTKHGCTSKHYMEMTDNVKRVME